MAGQIGAADPWVPVGRIETIARAVQDYELRDLGNSQLALTAGMSLERMKKLTALGALRRVMRAGMAELRAQF